MNNISLILFIYSIYLLLYCCQSKFFLNVKKWLTQYNNKYIEYMNNIRLIL